MSLVGFKITNHPQQVAKRGARDTVDERITPDREAIIEECSKVIDTRATEIEAAGNITGTTMARICRDEANRIRALKTAPNGEKK